MKVPFTVDQFLNVIRDYNLAVWPMQFVLYLLSLLIVYLLIRKSTFSNKLINLILALLWLWMGIVYHLLFFITINKAAYVFGFFTILQGLIFVYEGVFRKKLSYTLHSDLYGWTGMVFIVYALVIYPLIGYFSSHSYPYAPTFGLPCPTTIFTFGMLLVADKRISLWVLTIPILWAIIGTSAAVNFGIREDFGLIITTITTFILILYRNKKLNSIVNS
jgi:hypothetical protein